MLEETFAVGKSVLHRLDPRLKVSFAVLFSFFIALSNNLAVLCAGLACSLTLLLCAWLPLPMVLKRLRVINLFSLLLWLLLPITFEGEIFYRLGFIELTRPGLLLALLITLKANAILLAFISLVATSPLATIAHALRALHVPAKIVHLLMFAYRYVFVLEQEYHRLTNAARVRSFSPGTNIHTYKTYAYLFGMLLIKASTRAEKVYQAMLCRGFQGKFHCLYELRYARIDGLAAVVMGLALIALGWLQWIDKG